MEYPKEILVKDYFEVHNYYSNIYGNGRTIILMQVGSFHEAYSTDVDGLDLVSISQQLDVCCTRKNSNIPLSKTNPRMMGFPIYVTPNFIDKLIDLSYTIVIIDQVTDPPNPKRQVTCIYSPATHIEKKTTKTTFLVSIVLDKIKDNKTNTHQLCIGISAYDLTTGFGAIYETYSKTTDVLIGLDDTLRFLENYPPREIILENNLNSDDLISNMHMKDILSYLNIELDKTYSIKLNQHKKISWQESLLNKVYKNESNINIIDILGLQFLNWARLSLVLLLDYTMSHQSKLLDNLKKPLLFSSNKYLYLGNRALQQLDVMPRTKEELSLFDIINFTKTVIGKRYLKSQLSMPLINADQLTERYNGIQQIIENNHQTKIIDYLEDIYDLDKLTRKLEINIINPYELYQLYISFYQIIKLIDYLKTNNLLNIFNIDSNIIKKLIDFNQLIEKNFLLEKINELNFNNFTDSEFSFYNKNIHHELDTVQEQIDTVQHFMIYLIKVLESHMDEKSYLKKNIKKSDPVSDDLQLKSLITLKFNERDGHYMLITNRRCEILKKNLGKILKLNIGSLEVDVSDLEFTELPKSSNTKITCKKIKELSLDLVNYKILMAKKLKELFKTDMKNIIINFGDMFHNISKKIAYIDFINSGALCAINNHYSKPIIDQKVSSFFKSKQLRHPIIEKISTNTTFVPHDIELGFETEQVGILLYGINSSGKSTLMKSIGLNIILAQIGYFTASTSFTFSPYTSLFTRICGNDNMFRGQSSFMVEMMELMSILKRNDANALMIGDELAKGTELRSSITIVSYMLETLSKSQTSFITATHLHQIAELKSIKKLSNIKTKHLKITYDSNNDILIYDRHLIDGHGESFYGLQIAKYLMKDKHFNERTSELLNEYDGLSTCNISNNKVCKYNSNVFLSCCEICKNKQNLETHHIIWQKDFNNNNINESIFYLQKNDASNLVTLCMQCHDKVDRNEIVINGWKDTSTGRIFDYILVEKPAKISKYSQEIINFIKGLQNIVKNNEKMAQIKIKETYGKKITTKTIKSFWILNTSVQI
jgi:DNA mismatch repair protein MutS